MAYYIEPKDGTSKEKWCRTHSLIDGHKHQLKIQEYLWMTPIEGNPYMENAIMDEIIVNLHKQGFAITFVVRNSPEWIIAPVVTKGIDFMDFWNTKRKKEMFIIPIKAIEHEFGQKIEITR